MNAGSSVIVYTRCPHNNNRCKCPHTHDPVVVLITLNSAYAPRDTTSTPTRNQTPRSLTGCPSQSRSSCPPRPVLVQSSPSLALTVLPHSSPFSGVECKLRKFPPTPYRSFRFLPASLRNCRLIFISSTPLRVHAEM